MRRTRSGARHAPALVAATLAALAMANGAPARADEPAAPAPALAVDFKRALYLRYCGACHGNLGEGDGVVAQYMTPRPTDLRQIMKKHDNTFPFQGTMKQLDGSDNVRAHGNPDAPVWGEVWQEQPTMTPDRRAETRGKVMLITEYLLSIQDRPPIELNYKRPDDKKK